jgi:hypothetical protein
MHSGFWFGKLKERDNYEDLGEDGIIVLKWVHKFVMSRHTAKF